METGSSSQDQQRITKGPWTRDEDERLIALLDKYGPSRWTFIAKQLGNRLGKQCRERYASAIVTTPHSNTPLLPPSLVGTTIWRPIL
jgi:hypothetical protein